MDFLRYAEAAGGVIVDLAAGAATGADCDDLLISIEGVGGSNFADQICGSDRADVEAWFYRDDFGNEATPNHLVEANDLLDGRGGLDGIACDQNAELGANRLFGSAGNDRISGLSGRDYRNGSYGNDRLRGDAGQDELLGGAGEDHLWGGAGRDLLEGGKGSDDFLFTRSGDSGPSSQRGGRIVDLTRARIGSC